MNLKCATGHSKHKNVMIAFEEAINIAKSTGSIESPCFALIYCTTGYPKEEIVKALNTFLKDIPHAGSSGEGVISENFIDESSFSISVQLFEGDMINFESFISKDLAGNDFTIGVRIGRWLNKDSHAKCMLTFADGLVANFHYFLEGVHTEVSEQFPIFGGLSGDNLAMKETFQIYNGEIFTNAIVTTRLSGDFNFLWDVGHGSTAVGEGLTITKSDGNKIYEVDNKCIIKILNEYQVTHQNQNNLKSNMNLTIGMKTPANIANDYDELLIRSIMNKNDEEGWIQLPTPVKEGEEIWFARKDLEKFDSGIMKMISRLKAKLKGRTPRAIFHFDCAGRGKLFMDLARQEDLLGRMQQGLESHHNWCGFYTYGEVAPVNKKNYFHNLTAVLLVIT